MSLRSRGSNTWQLAVGALIVFGSLYPFDFAWPQDLRSALYTFLGGAKLWSSRGDVAGNLLLFVPWGMLQPDLRLETSRRWHWQTFVTGLVLATALQLLQIGLPSRDAAVSDIFWNGIGILVGQLAAKPLLNSIFRARPNSSAQSRFGLIILGLWLLAETIPILPSLDLSALKTNIKAVLNPSTMSAAVLTLAFGGMLTSACALHAAFGRRRAIMLLSLLLLLLPAAKLLLLNTTLHWLALLGWALGWATATVLLHHQPSRLAGLAFGTLILGLTVSGLEPFTLTNTPNTFNWLPFVGFLEGGMLGNIRELFHNLWLFSAILWLGVYIGGRLNGIGFFLIVWVTLLEIAQIWLEGRSADISPGITAIVTLLAMNSLLHTTRTQVMQTAAQTTPPNASTVSHVSSANPGKPQAFSVFIGIALWAGAVAGISWLIRQPGVPYNLRELFIADGHPLAIAAFILAIIWIGAGSWIAVSIAQRFKYVWCALPLTLILCSGVSLLLLLVSVTDESIMDIAGSNNLYWFVTNRQTWGMWWAHIFTTYLTHDVVAPFERTVRYIALYLPAAAFLAIALMSQRDTWGKVRATALIKAGLALIPLLWLCKGIAFDWSSTDNLNELIAPTGAFGMGGGAYLYLLMALIAANMAVVGRTHSVRSIATALLVTLPCLPLSWVLLTHGLSPAVEKYGLLFSGTQFLLGPDRGTPLAESTLQLRWAAVYVALQVSGSLGIMIARGFVTTTTRKNLCMQATITTREEK
ncbi:MAG: VanZ family protein [Azoarcus sp.]|nr:VanZ family protein [Azoarcus sp.]